MSSAGASLKTCWICHSPGKALHGARKSVSGSIHINYLDARNLGHWFFCLKIGKEISHLKDSF